MSRRVWFASNWEWVFAFGIAAIGVVVAVTLNVGMASVLLLTIVVSSVVLPSNRAFALRLALVVTATIAGVTAVWCASDLFGVSDAGSAAIRCLGPLLPPAYVFAVALLRSAKPRRRRHPISFLQSPWASFALVAVLVMSVFPVISAMRRYGLGGIAWMMSGDAQSFVTTFRLWDAAGPEHHPALGSYASLHAIWRAIGGGYGEHGTSGSLLLDRIIGEAPGSGSSGIGIPISTIFDLGTILMFLLVSSFFALASCTCRGRRLPPLVIVGVGLAPLSHFVLGVGLIDGFWSGLGVIAILTFSIAFAVQSGRDRRHHVPGNDVIVALALCALLSLVTWPLIAVVPIILLVQVLAFKFDYVKKTWSILALCVGLASVWAAVLSIAFIDVLSSPGSISAYSYSLSFLLLVGAPIFCFAACSGNDRFQYLPVLTTTCAGLCVLLVFYVFGVEPGDYYFRKFLWILSSSLFPILVVALLDGTIVSRIRVIGHKLSLRMAVGWGECGRSPAGLPHAQRRWAVFSSVVGLAVLLGALVLSYEAGSPYFGCIRCRIDRHYSVAEGWNSPSAASVDAAIAITAGGRPAVIWNSLGFQEDRAASFWTSGPAVDELTAHQSWVMNSGESIDSLCSYLRRQSGLVIYTRDTELGSRVQEACGVHDFTVAPIPA